MESEANTMSVQSADISGRHSDTLTVVVPQLASESRDCREIASSSSRASLELFSALRPSLFTSPISFSIVLSILVMQVKLTFNSRSVCQPPTLPLQTRVSVVPSCG